MHVMRNSIYHITTLALLLNAAACSNDSFGEFELAGIQQHQECLETMFPFEPSFLTARSREGSVGIFMQSRGGNFQAADMVYFEIFGKQTSGTTLELSAPGELEAQAIGEIEVQESCPDMVENFFIMGQIRLDEFDLSDGGQVSGELVNGVVMSGRTKTVIADSILGSWEIEVRSGEPYEEFYGR